MREAPERGDGVLLPAMRGTAVRGLRPQKKRGVPPLLHPDGQIELTAQAAFNASCAAIRKKEARPIDGAHRRGAPSFSDSDTKFCFFKFRLSCFPSLSYPLRCFAPPPLTIRGGMWVSATTYHKGRHGVSATTYHKERHERRRDTAPAPTTAPLCKKLSEPATPTMALPCAKGAVSRMAD